MGGREGEGERENFCFTSTYVLSQCKCTSPMSIKLNELDKNVMGERERVCVCTRERNGKILMRNGERKMGAREK